MKATRISAAAFLLCFTATLLPAAPAAAASTQAATNPCVAGIRAAFPAQWHAYFIKVAWRESRWQQRAVNPRPVRDKRGRSYGRASGCLQILPGYAPRFMRKAGCTNLLDGYCNARVARAMFDVAGTRPWRI